MHRVRTRLSFANVISAVALFVALGGGAYAAFTLPKNSVSSKNIVNGQVKRRDLASGSVRADALKIPAQFTSAGLTDDPADDCGSGSLNGWVNIEPQTWNRVGYYRAPDGIVHLRGYTKPCGSHNIAIFKLPPGFRPARNTLVVANGPNGGRVEIFGLDSPPESAIHFKAGDVVPGDFDDPLSLDGITFRCGPSGKKGCP